MIELVKKSILAGAGLTLLTADKMKNLVETLIREGDMTEKEARDTITGLIEKTGQTRKIVEERKKKILNDAFAFWLYGVLSDEIEERVEKTASAFLEQLHIPQRSELEDIRKRIERLEREAQS
jgi:polyhydroxyalkanoate synthesis regulator phasin